MKKTMICLLVCLLLVGTLCPVRSYADTTYSGKMFTDRTALAEKLDEIFAGQLDLYYDAGCTNRVNAALGSYAVPNSVQLYVGSYNGGAMNSGWSCWIYANAVYYTLFGEVTGNGEPGLNSVSLNLSNTETRKATYENFKNWGVRAGVGSLVRSTTADWAHSYIILGYDENTISILDGNGDGNGLVRVVELRWEEIATSYNYSGDVQYIIQYEDGFYDEIYPNYTDLCDSYYCEGEIEIRKDTNMKSLPCSMATREESATLQKCTPGMKFQVHGMYRNTAGNYWYRVSLNDGSYGYIYGRDARFTTASIDCHYTQNYFTVSGADLWMMNGRVCEKVEE